MKRLTSIFGLLLLAIGMQAAKPWSHGVLKVADNQRYL